MNKQPNFLLLTFKRDRVLELINRELGAAKESYAQAKATYEGKINGLKKPTNAVEAFEVFMSIGSLSKPSYRKVKYLTRFRDKILASDNESFEARSGVSIFQANELESFLLSIGKL